MSKKVVDILLWVLENSEYTENEKRFAKIASQWVNPDATANRDQEITILSCIFEQRHQRPTYASVCPFITNFNTLHG